MIGGSLLRTQLNPQIAQVRKRCFDKTVQLVKESTNSRIKTRRQNNLPSENGWLKAGSLALDVGQFSVLVVIWGEFSRAVFARKIYLVLSVFPAIFLDQTQ